MARDELSGSHPPSIPTRLGHHTVSLVDRVHRLVNKQIAHLDQKNVKRKRITFQQIHDVISLLDRTVVEYNLLLNGASPQPSVLPTWDYDWMRVFYQRWVKSPPPGWQVAD